MTLHALVDRLPLLHREQPRAAQAGMAVPARAVPASAELRIYLRRRRETWRSALLALTIAGSAVGAWALLLSRVA